VHFISVRQVSSYAPAHAAARQVWALLLPPLLMLLQSPPPLLVLMCTGNLMIKN